MTELLLPGFAGFTGLALTGFLWLWAFDAKQYWPAAPLLGAAIVMFAGTAAVLANATPLGWTLAQIVMGGVVPVALILRMRSNHVRQKADENHLESENE